MSGKICSPFFLRYFFQNCNCSSTLCRGKIEAAFHQSSLWIWKFSSLCSRKFFEMCDDDVETSDEKKIVIGDHQ